MTSQPVSVVIPHYGDPRHALALVGQLESQVGAPELEIIVVDDASPEPYPDDARAQVIRRPVNGGFGAAVNSGAAVAKHPYLLVLNSDLSIDATFVADLCAAAAPFEPAVVGPMVVGHDGASQWPGRTFPRTLHYFVEWLTILARFKDTPWRHSLVGHDVRAVAGATVAVDWLMGAALLIPRAEFRAVGGFDARFHMNCEEVDLQRRLRMRGVPSIFAGAVSVTHAGGASSGDHERRVQRLVDSRLRYAAKWREHPARIRASLLAASAVNVGTNTVRRLAGRDVTPARNLLDEARVALTPVCRARGNASGADRVMPLPAKTAAARRIVMISPILPRKNPDNAGERYVASLVETLSSMGAEVALIVPRTKRNREAEESTVAQSFVAIPVLDGWTARLGAVGAKVDRFRRTLPTGGFIDGIEKSLRARRALAMADVLDIQWEEQATALRRLKRWAPGSHSVVTLHDVLSQRFAREAARSGESRRAIAAFNANRLAARYIERVELKHADSVITFSEKDRRLLPDTGRVSVFFPPLAAPGVQSNAPLASRSCSMLFVGPLWRDENYEAVRWFTTEVLPRVRAQVTNATLTVAGAVPDDRRKGLEADGVKLLGFVEDLGPLYREAAVVVVPLRRGAGVKFKVVDALVRGVPIVTTSIGAEGIGDSTFRLPAYADAASFADAVVAALREPKTALAAADAAANWARRRYGTDQFRRRVAGLYGLVGASDQTGVAAPPRPGVSVVIPVRNGEAGVATQLEALAAQTEAGDIEVVISDNGSTDRTVDVARAYADCFQSFRVVDSGDKAGVSHARNVGTVAARGEYVLFVDADDAVQPGYVAAMRAGLQDADIVGGVAVLDDGVTPLDEAPTRGPLPTALGNLPYALGGVFGAHRDVLVELGGFDESFVGGHEEVDFAWRAQRSGRTLAGARAAQLVYRQHQSPRAAFKQYRRFARTAVHFARRSGAAGRVRASQLARSSLRSLPQAVMRGRRAGILDRARAAAWWLGSLEGTLQYAFLDRVPEPVMASGTVLAMGRMPEDQNRHV